MKAKKIIKYILLTIIMFLIFTVESQATTVGSFNVSAEKNELKVGNTTNLNISTSKCEGYFSIVSSDSNVIAVSKDKEWFDEKGGRIVLTAKKAGTATITVTATNVGDNQVEPEDVTGSKTVKVTVTEDGKIETSQETTEQQPTQPSNQTTTEEPKTETPKTEEKESEPVFKDVNETVYVTKNQNVVNVRSAPNTSSKILGKLNANDKTTRTGICVSGTGKGWSRIKFNGQTAYVITDALTTKEPEEDKSTDKSLKELIVKDYDLTPEFDPQTTKYSLTIKEDDDKLDITATPNDEKAEVTISGNENLKSGNNIIKITVTAEDGTTRIYNISVLKDEVAPENSDMLKLKKLEIGNETLEPSFSPDVTKYIIYVDDISQVTAKDIVAEAEDETVRITASESLIENGNKQISIILEDKEGTKKTIYEVIIKKPEENKLINLIKEKNSDNTIYYILGGIIAGLLILIIIIIICLRKTKDDDDYYDEEDDEDNQENDEIDNYDHSLKKSIDDINNNYSDEEIEEDDDDIYKKAKTQILSTDYNVFKDSLKYNPDDYNEEDEPDLGKGKKGKHF